MPLPFTNALDLRLLALVRDNPPVYDPQHPRYMDLDGRELVWQRIGDALGRPAAVCKSRWINIRDMMRRKIRHRLRHPGRRRYNYKYEDQMAFMMPHFREAMAGEDHDPQDFQHEEGNYECQEPDPADSLDVFLMSIGATLRKFSPYHLNQAKSKIFQVVQEFEMQQIMDKGGPSGVR